MPTEQIINKSLKRLYCSLLPTWSNARINLKNCLDIPLCIKLRARCSASKVGKERKGRWGTLLAPLSCPVWPSASSSVLGALFCPT